MPVTREQRLPEMPAVRAFQYGLHAQEDFAFQVQRRLAAD